MNQNEIDNTLKWGIVFSILWLAGLGSLVAIFVGNKASKAIQIGDYFMATAIFLCVLFFCRRFIFSQVAEKFPRTTLFFNRLSALVGIIIIVAGAVFLIFFVYMFCSNLFGDLAARNQ